MTCIQCGKVDSLYEQILNIDGDIVCSEDCKKKYEREMNYFLDYTVQDEGLFLKWMGTDM